MFYSRFQSSLGVDAARFDTFTARISGLRQLAAGRNATLGDTSYKLNTYCDFVLSQRNVLTRIKS